MIVERERCGVRYHFVVMFLDGSFHYILAGDIGPVREWLNRYDATYATIFRVLRWKRFPKQFVGAPPLVTL